MSQAQWDERFMLLTHTIAEWSKERGRKVGAVIVGPDNEIRATGFNGFPRGVDDDVEERHSRETGAKYIWSTHAEVNAVCNAARVGISLKGCRIYIPWYPCVNCTQVIIQSGITEVIAYDLEPSGERWDQQFKIAQEMLEEAKVTVRFMRRIKSLPNGCND